jgi:hypothetical protein
VRCSRILASLAASILLAGCTSALTPDPTPSVESPAESPSAADPTATPAGSASADASPNPTPTDPDDIWSNPAWSAEEAQAVALIKAYQETYDRIATDFAAWSDEELQETLSQYLDDGILSYEIDNVMTAGEDGYVKKSAETPVAVRIVEVVEDRAVEMGRSGTMIEVEVCMDLSTYELADTKGNTVKSGEEFVAAGEHYAPYTYQVFSQPWKIFEADFSAAGTVAPCW